MNVYTAIMTRATVEDAAGALVAIIERSAVDPQRWHVHRLADGRAVDVVTVTGWAAALQSIPLPDGTPLRTSDLAGTHEETRRPWPNDSQGRPWPRTLGEVLEGGERR